MKKTKPNVSFTIAVAAILIGGWVPLAVFGADTSNISKTKYKDFEIMVHVSKEKKKTVMDYSFIGGRLVPSGRRELLAKPGFVFVSIHVTVEGPPGANAGYLSEELIPAYLFDSEGKEYKDTSSSRQSLNNQATMSISFGEIPENSQIKYVRLGRVDLSLEK